MNKFKIDQIKHLIDLEGQKERVVLLIEDIINNLNRKIIESIDINNKTRSQTLRDLDRVINEYFKQFDTELQKQLLELGLYETEFYTDLINFDKDEDFKKTTKESQKELLLLGLLLGSTIKKTFEEQKEGLKSNLSRNVNIIYTQTTTKTEALNIIKVNLNRNSAQIKTLTRTSVTNQLNLSKFETLKNNKVERYQYVAILDNRTTNICRKLHNKIFEVKDKKAPKPPQHFNCRSSIVPIFNKEDEFNKDDTLKEFAKIDGNKRNIDKDGKFVISKNDIIDLEKRIKRDKNQFNI
jgi:SPP1 gp7 family putative phage head morphogenesis protein